MQLTRKRSSLKWIALLSAPVVLAAGAFLVIGIVFFMMLAAATQVEEPQTDAGAGTAVGTGGMVYTITPLGEKEIPKDFLPIYKAAGAKYGVPWNLLAAHHFVETRFSSEKNMTSPVGAVGHMQFMKKTWIN